MFCCQLRKEFQSSEDSEDATKVHEEPPDINWDPLFESYPEITLFSVQQGLKYNDGIVNLSDCALITVEEFKTFTQKLLSLDRDCSYWLVTSKRFTRSTVQLFLPRSRVNLA